MFVVTLPASAQKNPKAFVAKAKKAGADILEIRGDLTPRVKTFKSSLPLIVSPRGAGSTLIDRLKPEYVDLDLGEAPTPDPSPGHLDRFALSAQPVEESKSQTKLIISYHNYDRTPSLADLKKIVQKMCANKSWSIKIATKIVNYKDLLIHRELQDWMQQEKIRSIVLGMGDKAHYSRITSPMRNTLTYTFLHGTDAAAPGQLPLSMYRLLPQVSRPALFGIIGGEQVVHSLSPLIHNLLFQQHGIDALYSCFPTDDFKGTMKILEMLGIVGLSVTAPFKHEAFAFADSRDPIGKKLGTANTLIKKGGKWKAFNTDVIGVERGYQFLKSAQSIAILGAGGVVPAVIEGIRRINPKAFITVFARDPEKAKKVLCHGSTTLTMTDLKFCLLNEAINATADIVICAVSQDIVLPLPMHGKKSVAIDLRYGKETKFMKSAAAKGFRVYDGLPMLIHQALAQFQLFTRINPNMKNFNFDQYLS